MSMEATTTRSVTETGAGAVTFAAFGTALFSSAFLLFWIEPLFARMALPRLGGSQGVWNTCLVFFQASLLVGYSYAHLLARFLSLRSQAIAHLIVLAIGAAYLPIALRAGWAPPAEGSPVLPLLLLLTATLGWPFFALSANAPLLQHWFSYSGHKQAANPYMLYAASNAGSLAALLAYPFLLEPHFTLTHQSILWASLYISLMGAVGCCALVPTLAHTSEVRSARAHSPVAWSLRLKWLVYAALPSSLLLGVTGYVTTDIASIPLLWIAPLALYLLTFVLIFAEKPPISHDRMVRAAPFAVILAAAGFWLGPLSLFAAIAAHFAAFFVLAMAFHGELAKLRPEADRLTEFYFWMSLGGVVGGAVTALVSPLIFKSIIEYPLVLGLACVVPLASAQGRKIPLAQSLMAIAAILVVLLEPAARFGSLTSLSLSLWAVAMVAFFAIQARSLSLAAIVLLLASSLAHTLYTRDGAVVWRGRSFYGAYTVTQDSAHGYRLMFHGTTLHGVELVNAKPQPLTYYGHGGPLGDLMRVMEPRTTSVGVVGLGIGSTGCYARAGQTWTFFEIDNLVYDVAARSGLFRELPQCAPHAKIVLGDGRLNLERQPQEQFDILVLDAFSSDSIPVHLVTKEAFADYLRVLKPHGAIAIHITNRYFNLAPIIARIAPEVGLVAYDRDFRPPPGTDYAILSVSHWMVLARSPADLGAIARDGHWTRAIADPNVRLWTDDYSNLLAALK